MGDKYDLNGKRIIILGGTGSWGNELTTHLLENYDPKSITIYSRGELNQVKMKRKYAKYGDKLRYVIGDVRDKSRLELAMNEIDVVFDLAALKHVPVCEENPWEAVQTNIHGTHNAIDAAIKNKVDRFLFISTDKAVEPFNLYGSTKACAEKLVIAANNKVTDTVFMCVRGGNALGTSGSVIPLFKNQIETTNVLTVTNPDMTRFLMPLDQAMGLIFTAAETGKGGEVFVTKMKTSTVGDLAEAMVKLYGNKDSKIKIIGERAGEKLHEVLLSRHETPTAYEFDEYFIILPVINIPRLEKSLKAYEKYKKVELRKEYASNDEGSMLDVAGLVELLKAFFEKK